MATRHGRPRRRPCYSMRSTLQTTLPSHMGRTASSAVTSSCTTPESNSSHAFLKKYLRQSRQTLWSTQHTGGVNRADRRCRQHNIQAGSTEQTDAVVNTTYSRGQQSRQTLWSTQHTVGVNRADRRCGQHDIQSGSTEQTDAVVNTTYSQGQQSRQTMWSTQHTVRG